METNDAPAAVFSNINFVLVLEPTPKTELMEELRFFERDPVEQ